MGGYTNGVIADGDDILNLFSDLPEKFDGEDNIIDVEDWESLFGAIPMDFLEGICENDANSHSKELSGGFQAPSPTSVLNSRSSCSRVNNTSMSPNLLIPVRTRTKRPRHSTTCKWHLITLSKPDNTMIKKVKEKKKKKMMQTSNGIEDMGSFFNQPTSVRICSHCQVTHTPQWRAGPEGPNTLCNACGVRYRTGRLVPEYRPAASPTFVPSLHSNSHRRIIQMRTKAIQEPSVRQMKPAIYSTPAELLPMHDGKIGGKSVTEAFVPEQPSPTMSPPTEFVPMSSYLFDYI